MSAIKIKKKIKKKSIYNEEKSTAKKEEKYRFKFEKYNLEKKTQKISLPHVSTFIFDWY